MADQGQQNNQGQGQQPDLAAVLAAMQQTQADLATVVGRLVPVNQPVGFHLSPAQFDTNANIDLTSRAGRSIYEETQKGLHDKYDLGKDGLTPFVDSIKRAATRLGCDEGINSVVSFTPTGAANAVSVIYHYGELTRDEIKAQCVPFITGNRSQLRQAQNNSFMVDFTLNSLVSEGRTSMLTYEEDFKVGGKMVFGLLWKSLVAVPSLDSKSTTRHLRTLINNLPADIVSTTIKDWNDTFKGYVNQLEARHESHHDLNSVILEAYQVAGDARFESYWATMATRIDDGEGPLANATWKELLSKGITKYNEYYGDWGKADKRDQDFIALKAAFTKEVNALRGQLELKPAAKRNTNNKSKGKSKSTSKPPTDGKITKNKKNTSDKQRQKRDEAWKKTPPKQGEPHTKTVDGWQCHWCIHHMSWCGHTSPQCELGKRRIREQQDSNYVADPAVHHQMDFMSKLAGLSRLDE